MAVPADPRKVGDMGEMGDTGDSSSSRCTGEWAGVRMTDTRASTAFSCFTAVGVAFMSMPWVLGARLDKHGLSKRHTHPGVTYFGFLTSANNGIRAACE